ncbi:MAG: transcriptional repressor [Bacteroidales bacterium]|nr:transcriptional repressor [Bacteroidales bacterium]
MQEQPSQDEILLQQAGIRVTAVRLMIWKTIRRSFAGAFGLADLETVLPTVDRSTLFRMLNLLSEAHLLHSIDDGSASRKYCLCDEDSHSLQMHHIHFNCRVCQRTFCLTDLHIPQVALPEGFVAEDTDYVVKGICPDCSRRIH